MQHMQDANIRRYQEAVEKIGNAIQSTPTDAKVFCGVNDEALTLQESVAKRKKHDATLSFTTN